MKTKGKGAVPQKWKRSPKKCAAAVTIPAKEIKDVAFSPIGNKFPNIPGEVSIS